MARNSFIVYLQLAVHVRLPQMDCNVAVSSELLLWVGYFFVGVVGTAGSPTTLRYVLSEVVRNMLSRVNWIPLKYVSVF